MRVMHQSEAVKAEIGTSVRVGWPMEGTDNTSGSQKQRLMRIAITGEKGQGYLRVIGTELDGVWRLEKVSLFARNNGFHEVVLSMTSQ
jgi:hypothetical protein